jgi:hypothetical protein
MNQRRVFLSTFPQKTLLVDFDLFEYVQDKLQQHIFATCVCRFKRNIAEIGKTEKTYLCFSIKMKNRHLYK